MFAVHAGGGAADEPREAAILRTSGHPEGQRPPGLEDTNSLHSVLLLARRPCQHPGTTLGGETGQGADASPPLSSSPAPADAQASNSALCSLCALCAPLSAPIPHPHGVAGGYDLGQPTNTQKKSSLSVCFLAVVIRALGVKPRRGARLPPLSRAGCSCPVPKAPMAGIPPLPHPCCPWTPSYLAGHCSWFSSSIPHSAWGPGSVLSRAAGLPSFLGALLDLRYLSLLCLPQAWVLLCRWGCLSWHVGSPAWQGPHPLGLAQEPQGEPLRSPGSQGLVLNRCQW